MKKFSSIAIIFFCIFLINFKNFSQGCVAVRHMSCSTGSGTSSSSMLQPGQWQVSLGFRNLHSHRHFVGTEEQTQRALNNTEVINDSQGFEFVHLNTSTMVTLLPIHNTLILIQQVLVICA